MDRFELANFNLNLLVALDAVIAQSDLRLTGPSMLIRYFARLVPLQVLAPPVDSPTYPEEAYWHGRFDDDPAHAWLRQLVKETAQGFGLREQPRKRSFYTRCLKSVTLNTETKH